MNCKGLKGRKYKKCIKQYVSESKKRFPTFNQAKDTVITTRGTIPSAAKAQQTFVLQLYGQGRGEENNSLYSDGSYIARNKVKKKKSKK